MTRFAAVIALVFFLVPVASFSAPSRDQKRALSKQKAQAVKKTAQADRLILRGEALEAAGDVNGAVASFEAALALAPNSDLSARVKKMKADQMQRRRRQSDELYRRALSASQKGDDDRAHGLCREALTLDPANIQAQRMTERLEKRRR